VENEGKGTVKGARPQTNIHDNIYDLETRCDLLSRNSIFSRTKQSILPRLSQNPTHHLLPSSLFLP
jgi:hypothetical protein